MRLRLSIFCILSLLAVSVRAQQMTISYQGAIANSAGAPADSGTYSITVSFYSDESGTQPLWNDTFETMVRKGIFNIALGSGRQLPPPSAFDRPIWVGTRIGSLAESRPLSRLSAVPMSMNVADSAITSAKLDADYISSISVNGEKVTGKASNLNIVGNVQYDDGSKSLVLTGTNNSANGKGASVEFIAHNPCGTNHDGVGGDSDKNTVSGGCGNNAIATHGYATIGGGQNNFASGQWSTIGGGDTNYATGEYSTIAGGDSNYAGSQFATVGGGSANYVFAHGGTIAGGDSNYINVNTAQRPSESFIGGGLHDSISLLTAGSGSDGGASAIVGGSYNKVFQGASMIGGGDSNTIRQGYAAIAAGHGNADSAVGGFIGAGGDNKILGDDRNILTGIVGENSAIVSGANNTTTGNYDFIAGGYLNYADGDFASIDGGYGLKLGDHSFGFNGAAPTTTPKITDLSSSFSQVAYFGNVNMMLGNVDNTARALQFYSPNKSLDYASDSAFYSSFQAAKQTYNIYYTLPDTVPLQGEFLKAAHVTGDSVMLKWDTVTGTGGSVAPAGWLLAGNSSVPPPSNYLGTQDSEAFEIHVHNNTLDTSGGNQRVMRYEEGKLSPNIVGGSSFNTIDSNQSGVAILSGGTKLNPNKINTSDTFSIIVGGSGNVIDTLAPYSAILSGQWNHITGHAIEPGFGWHNGFDVIAGGRGNFMGADTFRSGFNFIGGGDSNLVGWGCYDNVISGGRFNLMGNAYGVIGGGLGNILNGPGSLNVIGGGYYNTVGGDTAINANCQYSSIVGGDSNMIRQYASYSGIVGGWHNTIDSADSYSTISGGDSNIVDADHAFLGDGGTDTISNPSSFSVLAGGQSNRIHAIGFNDTGRVCDVKLGAIFNPGFDVLGGGLNNTIRGTLDVLPGGTQNLIDTNSVASVLGGGQANTVRASLATIGGGFTNVITSAAYGSTIPGGVGLIAAASGQFVAGTFNKPDSTVGPGGTLAQFGNGMEDTERTNALVIRKDGTASVFGGANSGGATLHAVGYPSRMSTLYANNTINAWANVIPGDSVVGDTVVADIGVFNVHRDTTGTYTVTLTTFFNGDGVTSHIFTSGKAAITASIGQGPSGAPGWITVSPLSTNPPGSSIMPVFTITTFSGVTKLPSNKFGFQFQVVAE